MITVQVIDNATPALRRILDAARNPRGILMAAGRGVANLLRRHYTTVHAENPNKLGGPRTNFWLQVKRAVNAPVVQGTGVVVAISHPAISHKVTGGIIRAKRAKFLTIPVSPEAYGRTASTFEHETGKKLILIKSTGRALLASVEGQGRLIAQYILRRSVTQRPDPNALPPMAEMERAALQAATQALNLQLRTT